MQARQLPGVLSVLFFGLPALPDCVAAEDPPFAVRADPFSRDRPASFSSGDLGCGELLMHAEAERDGYSWQYGGVVPPDYGSFAECYSGDFEVCSAVFKFTQMGNQYDQTMDVYIWGDAGGEPGSVLCFLPNVDPGPVGFYPEVTTHVVPLEDCCVSGDWWVGYWPNWPGQHAGWYCGEDLRGPGGGCPLTKIAPGIGYPTGWQNVSIVWGPTIDMFVGAEVRECAVVPARESSWGRIKALYTKTGA